MSFDDYTVTIYWTTESGNASQSTFDVMAYSVEEAQEEAFAKFSDVYGDNYETTQRFDVELYEGFEEY